MNGSRVGGEAGSRHSGEKPGTPGKDWMGIGGRHFRMPGKETGFEERAPSMACGLFSGSCSLAWAGLLWNRENGEVPVFSGHDDEGVAIGGARDTRAIRVA